MLLGLPREELPMLVCRVLHGLVMEVLVADGMGVEVAPVVPSPRQVEALVLELL